jgi:hypothetical protein
MEAQTVGPPQVLGPIAGPGAVVAPAGVRFYGTDLGWTFEHRGQLFMLFGDTWPHAHSLCEPPPANDDSQATLPLAVPADRPELTIATSPEAPAEFARIEVLRGSESLSMGYLKTPQAAFSDGVDAFGIFGLADPVRCRRKTLRARPSCHPFDDLTCTQDVGVCVPNPFGYDAPCDLVTGGGCLPGQQCTPTATGLCVDPQSSESNGTSASLPLTVAYTVHFAAQDRARTFAYHSLGTLATNKFLNLTARAVRCFSGRRCGSDYRPGHAAVLVWGRSGYQGGQGRQAHMYLMAHRLPIRRNAAGQLRLRPRYFAGLHPASGEPLWSLRQSHAMPLAMDGIAGGSPDDEQPIVSQMAISWLGDPVNRWMMLYGGDLADYLLPDPASARPGPAPGSIRVRFADHPWGPWSAAEPHLDPGSPSVVGDPYGPGGILFHTLCRDQPPALCARTDPSRPTDFFFPGCPGVGALFDIGRFYAPNIIDAYTHPDGAGGLDVLWNVSTWNPYGVALVRTNVRPGPAGAPPATCSRGGTGPAAGLAGEPSRFRWCSGGA